MLTRLLLPIVAVSLAAATPARAALGEPDPTRQEVRNAAGAVAFFRGLLRGRPARRIRAGWRGFVSSGKAAP